MIECSPAWERLRNGLTPATGTGAEVAEDGSEEGRLEPMLEPTRPTGHTGGQARAEPTPPLLSRNHRRGLTVQRKLISTVALLALLEENVSKT
jgi:hypothetical protein